MISAIKKNSKIIFSTILIGTLLVITIMHFFINYLVNNIISTIPEHEHIISPEIYSMEIFIVIFTIVVSVAFALITMRRFKKLADQDLGKYLLILESTINHLVITDINGLILYANKGAQKMTGYTLEEMMGNTPRLWGGLMPIEHYKKLWQTIKYDQQVFYAEVKNKRKNQEVYYASIYISPIIDAEGKLTGFVATEEDITARKQTEQDLENTKQATENLLEDLEVEKEKLEVVKAKYESTLASIGDGVISIDKNGIIFFINSVAEKLLHLKASEIIGTSYHNKWWVEEQGGRIFSETTRPIEIVLKSQKIFMSNSYYYVNKNIRVPVSITIAPIILNDELLGVVDVFRDITHEREIDKAKTEFVSLASHQLRTPLTGIEWTIELFAKKEKLSVVGKRYLHDISLSAHRLTTLIKLLLSVSRIESGNVGVSPAPIELIGFIKKYLREIKIIYKNKNLSLTFIKHPAELVANTDSNLLTYILQNVISNAIYYTPADGKIEVCLKKKGEVALLEVQDTGIGIPQNEQAHIFEKFVRASNAATFKPDGTGLGLYIVREAVKLLGGKIWFESVEGKGSTFFVELPLKSLFHKGGKVLGGEEDFAK